ncbi:Cyclin-dependent kinase F-3 [Smittium mucronatum]|uniref:Cyclin-dependent kinase F-3 n=1 Tax=Smittium mucronatum TaxID=133383 RepID=A0A1R0GMP9_9FUNG|nr:Cyclin-dependent kinase F-3 [Smittium mucronatum]
MNKYQINSNLGEGAFSSVLMATDKLSNTKVAIKKMKKRHWKDSAANFEVEALSKLCHPNVIRFISSFREDYRSFLVFECMDCNLLEYIQDLSNAKRLPSNMCDSDFFIINISVQVLRGLDYIHSSGYFHRDLKPENILISTSQTGELFAKIADFGLARSINISSISSQPSNSTLNKLFPGRPLTTYVSTRWYRAPEVLIGSKWYNQSIDVWAVGTIVAELALKHPIFPGMNQIDQLRRIFSIIPLVSESFNDCIGWNEGLNAASLLKVPLPEKNSFDSSPSNDKTSDSSVIVNRKLKSLLSKVDSDISELIQFMLVLNPKHRPSSKATLERAEIVYQGKRRGLSIPIHITQNIPEIEILEDKIPENISASNSIKLSSKNINVFEKSPANKPAAVIKKSTFRHSLPDQKLSSSFARSKKTPIILKKLRNKSNTESIVRTDPALSRLRQNKSFFKSTNRSILLNIPDDKKHISAASDLSESSSREYTNGLLKNSKVQTNTSDTLNIAQNIPSFAHINENFTDMEYYSHLRIFDDVPPVLSDINIDPDPRILIPNLNADDSQEKPKSDEKASDFIPKHKFKGKFSALKKILSNHKKASKNNLKSSTNHNPGATGVKRNKKDMTNYEESLSSVTVGSKSPDSSPKLDKSPPHANKSTVKNTLGSFRKATNLLKFDTHKSPQVDLDSQNLDLNRISTSPINDIEEYPLHHTSDLAIGLTESIDDKAYQKKPCSNQIDNLELQGVSEDTHKQNDQMDIPDSVSLRRNLSLGYSTKYRGKGTEKSSPSRMSESAKNSPLLPKTNLKKSKSFISSFGSNRNTFLKGFSRFGNNVEANDSENGTENSKTFDSLKSKKIQLGSGYLWSKPQPLSKKTQSCQKNRNFFMYSKDNSDFITEDAFVNSNIGPKETDSAVPSDLALDNDPEKNLPSRFGEETRKEGDYLTEFCSLGDFPDFAIDLSPDLFHPDSFGKLEENLMSELFHSNFDSGVNLDFSLNFMGSPMSKPISFSDNMEK